MKPIMEDLLRQIRKLNKKKLDNIETEYVDDSLDELLVYLRVEEGIHAGATYTFRIVFKDDYLESPPDVMCCSDVWHPNMKQNCRVCCNLLKDDWEDGTTLEGIIATIYCLLENPEFENPLNCDVQEYNYTEEVKRRI